MKAPLNNSKNSKKIQKVQKAKVAGLSALAIVALSTSVVNAQSPYVQTYGKLKQEERAEEAAKQIQNSSKATTGSDKTKNTSTSTAASTSATAQKKSEMIVKPKQYVSAGPKWQQFIDYINLKPGQENLPLKFTILNGSSGTPPLKAINATLSGRNFFTQKDFQGKRKLSINLTDALTAGSTQIVFQAYGDAGSAFKWQITSNVSPEITAISPDKAGLGSDITAKGKNLPTDKSAYKVKVDNVLASVSDAATDNFKFKIPKDVKPGKDKKVEITISGVKMKTFKIAVQAAPELTYLSHISIADGQTLVIKGKNFSKDPKDIQVTFNGTKGLVTGSSEDSISVVFPTIENIPSRVTIQVKVGDMACTKPGMILGSMRNIPNNGTYSPFEVAPHLF